MFGGLYSLLKVKNLLRIIEAGSPSFAKNIEARTDFIDSFKNNQCVKAYIQNKLKVIVVRFKNIEAQQNCKLFL